MQTLTLLWEWAFEGATAAPLAATDIITVTTAQEEGQTNSTALISSLSCLCLLSWYLLSAKNTAWLTALHPCCNLTHQSWPASKTSHTVIIQCKTHSAKWTQCRFMASVRLISLSASGARTVKGKILIDKKEMSSVCHETCHKYKHLLYWHFQTKRMIISKSSERKMVNSNLSVSSGLDGSLSFGLMRLNWTKLLLFGGGKERHLTQRTFFKHACISKRGAFVLLEVTWQDKIQNDSSVQ